MKKELNAQEAREKALRYLEYRSHSEKELCDKLKRAGAKEEDIPTVMEFLREYGFVNDCRYAKDMAKDLKNIKKYGKHRIASELKFRGISSEYIEEALCELEDDEATELMPLVTRKIGSDFERKNIEKAIRYFVYRGYSYEDIKTCIDRLKENYTED